MLHFTNGEIEAQKVKHLTKVPIASHILELEFEPRCASTCHTTPIFLKRRSFLYYYPFLFQNMLPFILQKPLLCFCCPKTVEPEEGECQMRIHKCRFLQKAKECKCLHERGWGKEEVFEQLCYQQFFPFSRAKQCGCQAS